MNAILLIIDTLRYDVIAANGNPDIETPNMDRLAAESWAFDRSFTASYPTIPHRTDVMTGLYGGPFHAWLPLRHSDVTLPEVLADAGYCTQLIHDTPHLVNGGHNFDWPFHGWTFVRGAEVDRPWIDARTEWPGNWKRDPLFDCVADGDSLGRMFQTYARANRSRASHEDWNCAKLFRTSCDFLRDNASRENFFLWVDCFDPHEPWDAPPEFMKMYDDTPGYDGSIDPRSFIGRNHEGLSDAANRRIAASYSAKVSWVDRWVGELLDTLDATGLSKNTVVILTADHGTRLREWGRFGKGLPVREQVAHTPFMVRIPDGGSGRSDTIVQPQDIFATLCGALGVAAPAGIESHDVVAVAREGKEGARDIALSGRVTGWERSPDQPLFMAANREWYVEAAARLENSRLRRLGETDDCSAKHPDILADLHAAALDEIERRGLDPAIAKWVRDGGEGEWPAGARPHAHYPGPAGFRAYFQRLYVE